jgi:segregation and condensation protein A
VHHSEDAIVHLDAFDGPLDLLLHLIRRAEVDIANIPIAQITEQYLHRLEGIERIDIELAGEFLVMAATLMEIKSRMISPTAEQPGGAGAGEAATLGPGVDPRAELVQQLLAYKRVRDAAQALEERKARWESRWATAPAQAPDIPGAMESGEPDAMPPVDVEDLELFDLVEAFSRIMATVDIDRAVKSAHDVAYDDTPIELHAEDILDRLRRSAASGGAAPRMTLREMLAGRTRVEMVGLFLATLELVRRRSVVIAAEPGDREYSVALNDDPDAGAPEPPIAGSA